MISKVITGRTFSGTCRYICQDKKRAVVLETDGVRDYDHKLMAIDFEMQKAMRPSLNKAVFHGILSFYPGEKIDDEKMVKIAKEYLKKLGIINTQFAITKHTDKNHSHLHLIANLVNNNGETIKDNWIGLRGKKIAQELTLKYELITALSKNLSLTNLGALNEKETNRYIIYQAILEKLPHSKSLGELTKRLEEKNIETLFKYKGQTKELQGISFKIGEYKYKGSEIDRNFSVMNLEKAIQKHQIEKQLKQRTFTPDSKLLSQVKEQSHKVHKVLSKNIARQLIKPEQSHEQLPSQWRFGNKNKKKSKRLIL